MKNRGFLLSILLPLVVAACVGSNTPLVPMPPQSMWQGTVALPDGISVPLRLSLDFSSAQPTGYFLVGDEKTPVPEINKDGDSVTMGFSEYGAEIRAKWNGRQLAGSYLRIRSDGTKSFDFIAEPLMARATPADAVALTGNYQVLFQGEEKVDDTTVAKFWTKDSEVYGTFTRSC
jgi:hypothetical protein